MTSPDPDPYVPPAYRQPLHPAYTALTVGVIIAGIAYLIGFGNPWWDPDASGSDSPTGNGNSGQLGFLGLFIMVAIAIAIATLLSRRMYLAHTAYPGFIGMLAPLEALGDGPAETTGWIYLSLYSGQIIVLLALLSIVVRRRTQQSP